MKIKNKIFNLFLLTFVLNLSACATLIGKSNEEIWLEENEKLAQIDPERAAQEKREYYQRQALLEEANRRNFGQALSQGFQNWGNQMQQQNQSRQVSCTTTQGWGGTTYTNCY